MMRALNTAGTGMIAQQHNLDVIANNLANVNTTGFKQQRAEFQDLMYENLRTAGSKTGGAYLSPVSLQIGLGTAFTATAPNMMQGSVNQTSNPLDMAISGDGFFKVLLPNGSVAYTRDGSFKIDASGKLVTTDGYYVQPEVTIDPTYTNVHVSTDGKVTATAPGSSATVDVGPIKINTFVNPAGLNRLGQNLYQESSASGNASEKVPGETGAGTIMGGYLEASNVQVVDEMVKMITAQRAYEINSKAIQTADDMLNVVNQLKR